MHNAGMSKKIDAAAKDLIKAIRKHSKAIGDRHPRSKSVARASGRLQAATTAYTVAVFKYSGADVPFSDVVSLSLDPLTVASLEKERDQLKQKHSKK